MLILGEVHTGFLLNSVAVGRELSKGLLALIAGETVRLSERPIRYAASPESLSGIDCRLVGRSGRELRVVGTVVTRASITGGQILQGSSYVTVTGGGTNRQPWAHYLARPGVIEAAGRLELSDLADGFLVDSDEPGTLSLASASTAIMDRVQRSSDLDRRVTIRAARTRLRWAAVSERDPGPSRIQFAIEGSELRTLRLPAEAGASIAQLAAQCEDLALHDWLLTCLLSIIERSGIGVLNRAEVADRLMPTLEHLVHLWLPAARVERDLWDAINRRSHLGRQWQSSVDRVRALTADAGPLPESRSRPATGPTGKRIFVSYVREDSDTVDRIAAELRREGIDVWLDRTHLLPGDRWEEVIQEAIRGGDYFIACFSSSYAGRDRTFMGEELLIAIEQLRQRPHNRRWFLPLLLDRCEVPAIQIGPGATLRSLHAVDFSQDWEQARDQLVRAIKT